MTPVGGDRGDAETRSALDGASGDVETHGLLPGARVAQRYRIVSLLGRVPPATSRC